MDEGFLLGGLVFVAEQVEHAVDDDAVELFVKGAAELIGIFANAVYADEDIAFDLAFYIGIVEGDDVGVSLVVEVFDVLGAEVLVRTEYEIDLVEREFFLLNDKLDPGGSFSGMGKPKGNVFGEEVDCGHRGSTIQGSKFKDDVVKLNSKFKVYDSRFRSLR
jgi:hypothetical protein